MRTSTLGSLQLRPGVARRKKSAQKGTKKKSETEFTRKSGLLILITRITRAQSKEEAGRSMTKSHPISLIEWSPRMVHRIEKGLIARSLPMRSFVVRGLMERSLIDQGDSKTNLTMMSLDIAAMMRR